MESVVLCGCGCGEATPIAKGTDRRWGHVKGRAIEYCQGHAHRKSYVVVDGTGCWIWQGSSRSGKMGAYGLTYRNGRRMRVHRAFYEEHVGPIPEGHDVHHVCGNGLCVNPEHLETVEHRAHCRQHALLR